MTADQTPRGAGPGPADQERLVRELMQRAVAEVQPSPAAYSAGLSRVRRAVPRRRAARRGAWTGAAAVAVATAVLLPTLHGGEHLGLSSGHGTPTAHSGTASPEPGGTFPSHGTGGGPTWYPHPGGGTGQGTPSGSATASPSASAGTTGTAPGTTLPTTTGAGPSTEAPVPPCTRADLGQGTSQVGAADGAGRIRGSFSVVNTSGRSCRLTGPGAVTVTGASATDPGRIKVLDHTPGGPATGLPDGGTEAPLLAARAGYRVDFVWVPDGSCPTATPAPSGSPSALAPAAGGPAGPTASGSPSAVSPADGPTSTSPVGPSGPSPTAGPTTATSAPPPTVTIAHTPASGSPTAATAVLLGACSGTVYRGAPQPVGDPAGAGGASSPAATPSAG